MEQRRTYARSGLILLTVLGLAALGGTGRLEAQPRSGQQTQPSAEKPSQQEPTPEQMQAMMGPMMGQMMESMMAGMFAVLAKPETAQQLAAFSKNYFDALVAKGFSREEALRIVVAVGLPAIPGSR